MSGITTGFNLYLGVVLGKLAVIGIVFAVCTIIFILCCIFGKKVEK